MKRTRTAPDSTPDRDLHHVTTSHGTFALGKTGLKGTVKSITALGTQRIRITFTNLGTIIVYATDATEVW